MPAAFTAVGVESHVVSSAPLATCLTQMVSLVSNKGEIGGRLRAQLDLSDSSMNSLYRELEDL